jgi:hypothetical protein
MTKVQSKRILFWALPPLVLTLCPLSALAFGGPFGGPTQWNGADAPSVSMIKGGPWTEEQSGAANGLKSAGYCTPAGAEAGNPGTERMSPYYFPTVYGSGRNLQGFFDWRPKDTNEAVVAATSSDWGHTWDFQGEALELRTLCPTDQNKLLDGIKDGVIVNGVYNNADNTDDDGQGHQYVISINGHTYLYTLNRSVNHIDSDPLVIHDLSPTSSNPLAGAPAKDDGPTDGDNPSDLPNTAPEPPLHTNGLLNPDGILAAIPGTSPLTVIYEQKILSGDNTGPTALPVAEQCATAWSAFYGATGVSPNDDITYLRRATTTDGINFTDEGPLQGLNDPTDTTATGTRWLATAGTIMRLRNGGWGLFFSGGNCIDADSDSFHYIGYAESKNLKQWTVINGINNPIISIAPLTLTVDSNGHPITGSGTNITIPSNEPVVGDSQGWFYGRVYAPSATKIDDHEVTMVFAGYHTQKPKNGLGDYRNIGRVRLNTSADLQFVGPTLGQVSEFPWPSPF